MEKMRVGVLMGGPSSEREISLLSGRAIYRALKKRGYNCIGLDVGEDAYGQIRASGIDVAFIALHGRFGEDGTMQAMLEELEIPYTGSGPLASRLGMDKVASREIFQRQGIPVPKHIVLKEYSKQLFPRQARDPSPRDPERMRGAASSLKLSSFKPPLVVKPSSCGSSIGLSMVEDNRGLATAMRKAFEYDDVIMIEEYIRGKEVTVGILDEEPLPVIWLIPKRSFFDYRAKYEKGMTLHIVPAPFAEEVYLKIQEVGLRAHRALGCRDFSRVDMFLDEDQTPRVLELNSIPGFTATSLLPMAAQAEGYSFEDLCSKLLELAARRRDVALVEAVEVAGYTPFASAQGSSKDPEQSEGEAEARTKDEQKMEI